LYNLKMLQSMRRPVIFAHRGDSAHAPENTLAAFRLAAAEGADAIELDAKLSADGQVMVFHDERLERTTDGVGRVRDKPAVELRSLDAGGRFAADFRGERIPFLSEVLENLGNRLLINIELRNYWTPRDGLVREVCELVKQHAVESSIMFSSFLAANLRLARRLLPGVPCGLIAMRGWPGLWARSFGFSFGDCEALHPHVADTTAQQVRRVHRLKRRIHVWTVNARAQVQRLVEWGVDGIITDDPRLVLEAAGRGT
jgi:glycerophosphoryl diester phosphodiesterase